METFFQFLEPFLDENTFITLLSTLPEFVRRDYMLSRLKRLTANGEVSNVKTLEEYNIHLHRYEKPRVRHDSTLVGIERAYGFRHRELSRLLVTTNGALHKMRNDYHAQLTVADSRLSPDEAWKMLKIFLVAGTNELVFESLWMRMEHTKARDRGIAVLAARSGNIKVVKLMVKRRLFDNLEKILEETLDHDIRDFLETYIGDRDLDVLKVKKNLKPLVYSSDNRTVIVREWKKARGVPATVASLTSNARMIANDYAAQYAIISGLPLSRPSESYYLLRALIRVGTNDEVISLFEGKIEINYANKLTGLYKGVEKELLDILKPVVKKKKPPTLRIDNLLPIAPVENIAPVEVIQQTNDNVMVSIALGHRLPEDVDERQRSVLANAKSTAYNLIGMVYNEEQKYNILNLINEYGTMLKKNIKFWYHIYKRSVDDRSSAEFLIDLMNMMNFNRRYYGLAARYAAKEEMYDLSEYIYDNNLANRT